MIPVKVQCQCGQRYSFEVEPVGGRMPAPVTCPACGADGTAAANAVIARTAPTPSAPPPPAGVILRAPTAAPTPQPTAQPAAMPVPAPMPVPTAAPVPTVITAPTASPTPAAPPFPVAAPPPAIRAPTAPQRDWGPGGEGDTWKWWYYVLAGVCIAGYDIWRAYDTERLKPLGGLFLAVLLIAIGLWDFNRKRKRRLGRSE